VVVFVEEAQGIALDNLEFLRLLTNLETATDKLLQIVLFGQPELDAQLADPRIRQLKDRITLSLNLSPLAEAEVAAYLRARLAVAGYRGPDLFPPALITRMTQLSGGLSRRINVLADKTLLAAYAGQTHTLTPAHLEAAAGDADLLPPRARPSASLGVAEHSAWQPRWACWRSSPGKRCRSMPCPVRAAGISPARSAAAAPAARRHRNGPANPALARRAAPGTHVIQLASAKEAAQAAVLLGSLNAATPQPVRVLHGLSQGAPAWMILAGEFPSRDAAMAALRTAARLARAPVSAHGRQNAHCGFTSRMMMNAVLKRSGLTGLPWPAWCWWLAACRRRRSTPRPATSASPARPRCRSRPRPRRCGPRPHWPRRGRARRCRPTPWWSTTCR
jgi:MSHA biogenesis protein MshM